MRAANGRWAAIAAVVVVAIAGPAACRHTAPGSASPAAVRLIDVFKPDEASGASSRATRTIPRTEWRFDEAAGKPSKETWEASAGVAGLAVKNGRLTGKTTDPIAILHLKRLTGLDNQDVVHAVEVRMRASAGKKVAVNFGSSDKFDVEEEKKSAAVFAWPASATLTPGDDIQTYTITSPFHTPGARIKHLMLVPSDTPGASFEIESVRLIFRKEYLESIPSGVTWQGLKEIYRESIAAHAPETLRVSVKVPERAWLDLGVGTIEDAPMTFRVSAQRAGGPAGDGDALAEHTVTTPHRWEPLPIDLSRFSGQTVTLSLALASDDAGALGFWGSPVVRVHAGQSSTAGSATRPRGIVLIQADTLRRDHLGLYGYSRETAPMLRKLAGEGTTFRNYTVQATWTKVSTPTLMTSLYPLSHGVRDFYDRLPAAANTLAESLRSAGYATVSYSSVIFTGQFSNLHKGFDELHEDGSLANPESSKNAREFVDRLGGWLEAHKDGPFFAFLHVFDPHDPYEPKRPYDAIWADPAKKDEHERQAKEVKKFIKDPLRNRFGMPSREELTKAGFDPEAYVRHDTDWYDGSIRGLDVEIARLVEKLRALGIDNDTLIVFLSDHGEEFLEHGNMFHGQTVYGELTQVPLIMRWPARIARGRVMDEVVQTVDVMPTLLELSGVKPPPGIQGQSLAPLVLDGAHSGAAAWKRRPALTEKARTEKGGAPPPHETESYAIVDGGWKLVHNVARPDGAPEFELYDFVNDPLNKTDVAAQHPDIVSRLSKALDGWRQMATAARLKPDAETNQTLSPAQLQRLRSLGYVK